MYSQKVGELASAHTYRFLHLCDGDGRPSRDYDPGV